MTNLFSEFIGEKLERVHFLPEGLGDYKTVMFSFAGGRCLTFEVELQTRPDAIYPAMRVTQGNWELIKVEPEEKTHKPGCASFNSPPKGFASSVTNCDCQDE